MKEPLITTLIPTYQRPHLLKRALKSILAQTEKRFLVCVYDNASHDETPDVVAQFQKRDSRIKYVRHPHNIGMDANFKIGVPDIATPFFSFLSDDDFLFPWFYETALKEFEKYPDIGFAATRTVRIYENGKIEPFQVLDSFREGYHKPLESTIHILNHSILWTGIVYKTEILKKLKGLRDNVGHSFDEDFTLRASLHFPFSYTKKESACFLSWQKGASHYLEYYNCWIGYKALTSNLINENVTHDDFEKFKRQIRKDQIARLKKLSLKYFIQKKGEAKVFLPHLKEYMNGYPLFSFLLLFPFCHPFVSMLRNVIKQIRIWKYKGKIRSDFSTEVIQSQIKELL